MEEKHCDSLADLEARVSDLKNELNSKVNCSGLSVTAPLFRGHASNTWKLETTLERYTNREFSVDEYSELLWALAPKISAVTGRKWKVKREDFTGETRHLYE